MSVNGGRQADRKDGWMVRKRRGRMTRKKKGQTPR
jgi:hypothetical protein